jgi:hypothetical protein
MKQVNRGSAPIMKPEDMPYPLKCTPMSKDWKARVKTNWWSRDSVWVPASQEEYGIRNDLLLLRDKLLPFGGEEACITWREEDFKPIMERGVFRYGVYSKLIEGRPVQCHANSCDLYESNKGLNDVRISTGYALSKDGMWRCHSWLVWYMKNGVQRVVETTVRRVGYFGFEMTPDEADQFCFDNF